MINELTLTIIIKCFHFATFQFTSSTSRSYCVFKLNIVELSSLIQFNPFVRRFRVKAVQEGSFEFPIASVPLSSGSKGKRHLAQIRGTCDGVSIGIQQLTPSKCSIFWFKNIRSIKATGVSNHESRRQEQQISKCK